MSEQETSGQPTEISGADPEVKDTQVTTEDKVSYSTYRKILSEKKKLQDAVLAEKNERDALKQKLLEAEGKKDELVEALRRQLNEERDQAKKVQANFAWTQIQSQFASVARDMGCLYPDLALNAVDLSTLEVKDNFQVDQTELKVRVEEAQKKFPKLFEKKVEAPRDAVPQGAYTPPKPIDLKSMSVEQLKELARQTVRR